MQNMTGFVKNIQVHYADSLQMDGVFKKYSSLTRYFTGSGDTFTNSGFEFDSYLSARTGYDSTGTLIGSDVTHGKQLGVNYIIKSA